MNIILANRSKTIKRISREIGIPTYLDHEIPPLQVDRIIRWGSTRKILGNVKEYNKRESIILTSDKGRCRDFLMQNGILVPRNGFERFPVIGRTKRHTQGRGFFYCRSMYEVEVARRKGATYFSQYYPKKKEYRLHIGHDKVLLMGEKIGDTSRMIFNHRNGFIFKPLRRHEWDIEIVRLGKSALRSVGLDFGAIDIMADAGYGYPDAVISEINTAPALSPYSLQKYSEYFERILSGYYD